MGSPTCRVTIAEGCVEADVSQLAAAHVLLLGRDVAEDDLAVLEAHLLGRHVNVRLTHLMINSYNWNGPSICQSVSHTSL